MQPPKTVLEQEYDRIYRTDMSSKSEEEVKEFVRVKTNYTRVLSSIQYKLEAQNMSQAQLEKEKHKSSRLGRFLVQDGMPKPGNGFEAHAIIAGLHQKAAFLRVQMAIRKIRIDDADNGCWLPKTEKDAIGTQFPNAVPHRRIHNHFYFDWLSSVAMRVTRRTTEKEFRFSLNRARKLLQSGAVAHRVLKPKAAQ